MQRVLFSEIRNRPALQAFGDPHGHNPFFPFPDGYCIHAVLADCEFVLDKDGAVRIYLAADCYQHTHTPFTGAGQCPEVSEVLAWLLQGVAWPESAEIL